MPAATPRCIEHRVLLCVRHGQNEISLRMRKKEDAPPLGA